MLNLDLGPPSGAGYSILCLGAHPDDIEIGAGGTVLKLLERYDAVNVHWIVFSSNEERAQEARESADAFLARAGTKAVIIEDFRNSFFPFVGAAIKERFEQLKASVRPDLILSPCRDDLHQDHRLISELTWNTFRDHLILEYEIPKYDGDLGVPNVFSLLDEMTCHRKIDLITKYFRTQQHKQWFDAETFMAILRLRGVEANSPTRYAEAFYCRKVRMG